MKSWLRYVTLAAQLNSLDFPGSRPSLSRWSLTCCANVLAQLLNMWSLLSPFKGHTLTQTIPISWAQLQQWVTLFLINKKRRGEGWFRKKRRERSIDAERSLKLQMEGKLQKKKRMLFQRSSKTYPTENTSKKHLEACHLQSGKTVQAPWYHQWMDFVEDHHQGSTAKQPVVLVIRSWITSLAKTVVYQVEQASHKHLRQRKWWEIQTSADTWAKAQNQVLHKVSGGRKNVLFKEHQPNKLVRMITNLAVHREITIMILPS